MALWLKVALSIVGGGVAVAVLATAIHTGKPLRRLLLSAVQGLCALGAVDVLGGFTGVSLGLSWFSVGVCGVLGAPGVVGLLLLKLLLPPVS